MNPASLMMFGFGVAVVAIVLYFTAWRAMLFLKPDSIRIEADEPPDKLSLPGGVEEIAEKLMSLGFVALGSHWEKPAFTRETISYDYVNKEKKVFASIYEGRDGSSRMYLLTQIKCPDGSTGYVITANYRRPARELRGCYYSGGLEDYAAERVLKAHLRRIDNEKLQPIGEYTADERLFAGRAWFKTYGKSEIRSQNLHGLLWSAGALSMLVLGAIRLFS